MKILVDEMPESIFGCPYFEDIEDGCYACVYKKRSSLCTPCGKDPKKCPYFKAFPDAFKEAMDKYDFTERDSEDDN